MLRPEDCLNLNRTEAYQLCREAGIPCYPHEPIEHLVAYLTGAVEPPRVTEGTHPIDSWRHGLAGFVMDHWSKLQPQLTCPIRSGDPRSCFECLDTQVLECVVKNPANEKLIQLHRKRD
jgi:hypothetical protein